QQKGLRPQKPHYTHAHTALFFHRIGGKRPFSAVANNRAAEVEADIQTTLKLGFSLHCRMSEKSPNC
ncbi:MAG: hypothetical protein AAFR21_14655, partial [Pseudomonadota bacterium]